MTNGVTKFDSAAPPSYAAATSQQQPTTTAPGPSRNYGPTPINQGLQVNNQSVLLDPRSQTAQEEARHRAAMRFCEAFLWAVIIQALAAAIIGGSLWPEFRRHALGQSAQR